MFTDSHCHLTFPELAAQLPQIRQAMALAQVERALCICTTLEEFDRVHALALGYDNFWATVGVHPDNEGVTEPRLDDLVERGLRPRVVGIGETGLDYFRLAGRSVACIHTPENRREIVDSRVNSVRAIDQACRQCKQPPSVLVQAASLAIYGDPDDRICDETAPHGTGFSVEVCEAWEGAFFAGVAAGEARRVALRIGFVLGRDGGALKPLANLARWFLGGAAGSGRQYISWVHIDDFSAMCRWAIENPQAQGAYNATGPAPATNAEFMRALRATLGRPWAPPTPAWAVKLGARFIIRADPDLALGGRRCVPRRLLDEGFAFRHTDLGASLRELLV